MRPSLIHRFLGLAGIYAALAHHDAALRAHAASIEAEEARNDRQDTLMSDITATQQTADEKVQELSSKVLVIVTGVSDLRTTLQQLKDAAANPIDATTLSAAGSAALDSALAQIESLAATFAAPAAPSTDGEIAPRDLAPGETLQLAPTPDGLTSTPIDTPMPTDSDGEVLGSATPQPSGGSEE